MYDNPFEPEINWQPKVDELLSEFSREKAIDIANTMLDVAIQSNLGEDVIRLWGKVREGLQVPPSPNDAKYPQHTNKNIAEKESLLKGLNVKGFEEKLYSHETVLNVMEEYKSKSEGRNSEAVLFTEWCIREKYNYNYDRKHWYAAWDNYKEYSTKELYAEYKIQNQITPKETVEGEVYGYKQVIEDYKEVFADHNKLVRELDIALNGDNAAKQASLCDIISQIRGMGEVYKWVSVEDILPNKSGYYQVYDENGLMSNKIEVYRFDKYNKSWYFGSDCYHPSYWMPLPSPPKEQIKPQQ